jgi:hypothetical protein
MPVCDLGQRGRGLLEHEQPALARLDVDDRGALVERVRLDGCLEAGDQRRAHVGVLRLEAERGQVDAQLAPG